MSYFSSYFKNIHCYVMSEVSLKRFYFVLFDDGLTLKTLKLAFISFWIQTLRMYVCMYVCMYQRIYVCIILSIYLSIQYIYLSILLIYQMIVHLIHP